MADVYDDPIGGPNNVAAMAHDAETTSVQGGQGAKVSKAVNLAGGLMSLGLILGAGVWGYKLLVRDVTGVPVVRALEGPIRVAPDDPGGSNAAHQGLAVNQVAAAGTTGGPSQTVILAPAPLNLAAEDLPAPKLPRPVLDEAAPRTDPDLAEAPVEVEDTPEDALATDMAVAEALSDDATAFELPEMTGDPTADALALAEALSAGVAPLSGITDTASVATALRDERGLSRSPRPPARPGGLSRAPAPAAVQTDAGGSLEVAADEIPSGTRLVQLGAFESAEVARDQWAKIGGQFEDYFAGKQRVVQRAQSGGKTFYRLRAMGFADLSDARRFCSALMAEKADCIPVVVR